MILKTCEEVEILEIMGMIIGTKEKEVLISLFQEAPDYQWVGEDDLLILKKALRISMTNFQ